MSTLSSVLQNIVNASKGKAQGFTEAGNYVKQQLLRMRTDVQFLQLIEIEYYTSEDDCEYYRYSNGDESIVVTEDDEEKTFEPFFFDVTPPERTETSIGDATLTLSAVDQEWVGLIRNTQIRPICRFIEGALYTDDDGEQQFEVMNDTKFVLTNASWDDVTISWTMVFDENLTINVPCDKGSSTVTPGCC